MPITITETAAAEIKRIIQEQALGPTTVLRVGIKGRNATGFNYLLDLTEVRHPDDVVNEARGLTVVADPLSFPCLDGTEIGYKDEDGRRGFVFNNPHAVPLPVHPPGASPAGPAPTAGGIAPVGTAIHNAVADRGLESAIIERLRTIFDPEIPVNIYDLGLIYRIDISAEKDVTIDMTLTAPGCPVAGSMPPAVQQAVESVDAVRTAKVNLVWDPPWGRERMSPEALLQLGLM